MKDQVQHQFQAASTLAEYTDGTFWFIFIISAVLLAGITAFMLYCCIRYSRKNNKVATNIHGDAVLETVWTVIPTILVMFMFWYGWKGYKFSKEVPPGAFEITVKGMKWNWSFTYPRKGEPGFFTYAADTVAPVDEAKKEQDFHGKLWATWKPSIVVPINTPIKVNVETTDIIHSFSVPAFRIKADAVLRPKIDTQKYVWFEATKLGEYDVHCTEYCGKGHSQMSTYVKVVTKEEFEQWWAEMTAYSKELEANNPGLVLYKNKGCISCHSTNGDKLMGPSFKTLISDTRNVIDLKGKEIKNVKGTLEYVTESIRKPNAKVVSGYQNLMTPFDLTDEEIEQIYEYMKTLQ